MPTSRRCAVPLITRLGLLLGALVAAAVPVTPQSSTQWDFLTTASIFPGIHDTLPAYLKAEAGRLLDERQREIGNVNSVETMKARQAKVRERMWHDLGGQPERTPLNARTVGVLDRGDYKIEKILFESRPRFYVTANLYLPKQGHGPFPAILYPLGHEEGAKSHIAWQQTLVNLTRRGFVCLTWDPIGQGERIQFYDEDWRDSKLQASTTEHSMLGLQSLLVGTHIAQYAIWDGLRALDYLLSRPEVDAKRVGCTGNSGGGTHTAYITALDDRIQTAAASCYFTSWRRLLDSIGPQDAEQVFPFWLKDGFDFPDFIYASGGKPYLVLSAIRDFFPIGGARASFAEAERVYEKAGLGDRISKVEADDGHGYTLPRREAAYRWFTRQLEGAENKQPETPVQLASEEELQCTRTGQVKTAFPDGADVHSINLERALRLAKSRKYSPEAVRSRAMELTRYQAPQGPVAVTPYGQLAAGGVVVEKLTYESEPGIVIPSLLFHPAGGAKQPGVILLDSRGKAAMATEAEALARSGNVVLVPDLRGFGETQQISAQRPSRIGDFGDYNNSMTALLVGKTMIGMRARDIVRGVDLLVSRSDVDAGRIRALGNDSAALPLLYAAVFDQRIGRIALAGMLSSYQSVLSERLFRGLADQIVPGALEAFDIPDLVSALAPREVTILNGVNPLGQPRNLPQMQEEFARGAAAYQAARASNSLRIEGNGDRKSGLDAVFSRWNGQNTAGRRDKK